MRIPRPPSPPQLSLPHDSDDHQNFSQPPLCTPVDQPVQHIDAVTASPIRKLVKRRRTHLNPVPPLQLHSLPPNSYPHPMLQKPPPLSYFTAFNDDDSQPANSQSFSQRDLPEMSQDTLALFPHLVRDHHCKTKANLSNQPTLNTMSNHLSDTVPPTTHPDTADASISLAKASMLSILSGSGALFNPFHHSQTKTCRLQNHTPRPATFLASSRLPNASESVEDFAAQISADDVIGASEKDDKSNKSLSLVTAHRRMDEEKLLKLLLVSSSQGRKLSLDFVMRGLAGKGAFSEVFKVTHRLDGTRYAVKKNLVPMTTSHARKEAIREVFALAALQGHPNIIRYHDAWFEEKGRFLLIQTEFLSAGSLYSLFIEENRPMSAKELFFLASDMSQALHHIHNRGIVHLDVKPDNIFQAERGQERPVYVIGDFGLACHKDGCDARSTEGDARYLCPEALQEASPMAPATKIGTDGNTRKIPTSDLRAGDMFSLGMTLYELGMGVPLEKSSGKRRHGSREKLAAEVGRKCSSTAIGDIVRRCVEPDPRRRASADEIRRMCSAIGSLESAAEKACQERRIKEAEQKLEECRAYLSSLLKKGEQGREEFRRKYPKRSTLAPSRVMSR